MRTNDLDQVLKGYRIENIGQTMSQGEFVQENLKKRENIEDDIDKEEEEEVAG